MTDDPRECSVTHAADVAAYLAGRKWVQTSRSDAGTMWRHPDTDTVVAVPATLTSTSFEWTGVVERIGNAERIPPSTVAERLTRLFIDVTDEGRSLYERAAAAADAGKIAAPERRPTLRAEETYVTDENIIERANREQAEAWAELEALRAEIERLRAAITAWADAWDAADRGEERDDGVGVHKYAERQEMELRKAVGR